ncbi:hypothetical protein [Gordonia sp. CPCC 205333]|uniref:hypothetical protein n=1 Tax=Gordonia sp. CPCC 205333 TaxID=3140790 RepID=UPI003AF33242
MTTYRSVVKRVSAALVAGAAMVLVAGCSGSVSIGGSDAITKAGDAPVGSCVRIGTEPKDGKVEVFKASCDTSGDLTFIAASVVPAGQECADQNYSHITFDNDSEKLCVASNFAADTCYQIPTAGSATLADYRRIECSATPKTGTTAYRVVSRTEGTATCPAGQQAVNYAQPKPLGFCLEAAA